MQSVLLREYLLVLKRLELMLERWLRHGLRLRRRPRAAILLMAVLGRLLGQGLLLLAPSRLGVDVVCHFLCCRVPERGFSPLESNVKLYRCGRAPSRSLIASIALSAPFVGEARWADCLCPYFLTLLSRLE